MSTPASSWCDPGTTPPPEPPPAQVVPVPLSVLCALGWRPLLITGLLRDLLVRHFKTPDNIESPDLKRYDWCEGERSGILIESVFRWRGDLVEKRPALLIKRNAYQNVRWGIADKVRTTEDGQIEFCTGWAGSHTVFCIHGSGASAELLATETQRELHQFAWVVQRYLGLLRWGVTQVGAIAEVEESKGGFVVPVTVGWAYQESWKLSIESLKLRRVPLDALLRSRPGH